MSELFNREQRAHYAVLLAIPVYHNLLIHFLLTLQPSERPSGAAVAFALLHCAILLDRTGARLKAERIRVKLRLCMGSGSARSIDRGCVAKDVRKRYVSLSRNRDKY